MEQSEWSDRMRSETKICTLPRGQVDLEPPCRSYARQWTDREISTWSTCSRQVARAYFDARHRRQKLFCF